MATSPLGGWLASARLGNILGLMSRGVAVLAHDLHRAGDVGEIAWTGESLIAKLSNPFRRVLVEETSGQPHFRCSECGESAQPCGHAGAVLMRWLEVRPGLLQGGPGASWRAGMTQAFRAPASGKLQEIDLTHQGSGELTQVLRFLLSRFERGEAEARIVGERVEIRGRLSSGVTRVVALGLASLPEVIGELRGSPRLHVEGELARVGTSSARLDPVLRVTAIADGVLEVTPAYRLAGGELIESDPTEVESGWVRRGLTFHPRPALPERLRHYFLAGRRRLEGEAAVRFLGHEHIFLRGERWYEPTGELAGERPVRAELLELDLTQNDAGEVVVRPGFGTAGRVIPTGRQKALLQKGFVCEDDRVLLPPDLSPLTDAGLKRRRGALVGDRLAALRLAATTRLPTRARQPEVAALLELLSPPSEALPDPPGLRSELRPYQRAGAAWLLRLYRTRLGALLADEMGLGKTHQVMALLCLVRAGKPAARSLVVCPRGVLEHWRHLLASFAPELPVLVFHGPERSLAGLPDGAVVLTTYDIAVRSAAVLAGRPWEITVFDEAQRAKNPRTKGARAVKAIPANFRVALTGTPIENNLRELWSVMELVVPGYLGSERSFAATFREPSAVQLERLRARLAPFTLRRVKEQVLTDLPEKLEEVVYCELDEEQRTLYHAIHAGAAPALARELGDRSRDIPFMHIFALITRLKQVCDHPRLVDAGTRALPGKLELLDELLDEALAAGNRVVVFSQYVKMIEMLSEHLTGRKLAHLAMTGKTRDRASVVSRFNSSEGEPVLLASLLASGVGIDLTAASVVVHYDRWWNPAKENQASDRVHRIGQSKVVQVFKLVTTDTIEERIEEILHRKGALARAVVAPTEEVLRGLSREELAELLGIALPPQAGAAKQRQ